MSRIAAGRIGRLRRATLRLDSVVGGAEAVLLALLVLALTTVTFAQVVERYVFSDPLIWSEEAARYLFVWVTLIGAALGLRESGHYGLDALVRRLPAAHAARRVLGLLATAIVAAFLVVLMVAGIAETRQAALQEAATLPIRMHWPYLALPVGAGLMLFHLLAQIARDGVAVHPLGSLQPSNRGGPALGGAVAHVMPAARDSST